MIEVDEPRRTDSLPSWSILALLFYDRDYSLLIIINVVIFLRENGGTHKRKNVCDLPKPNQVVLNETKISHLVESLVNEFVKGIVSLEKFRAFSGTVAVLQNMHDSG